jgi:hypothetical protein
MDDLTGMSLSALLAAAEVRNLFPLPPSFSLSLRPSSKKEDKELLVRLLKGKLRLEQARALEKQTAVEAEVAKAELTGEGPEWLPCKVC